MQQKYLTASIYFFNKIIFFGSIFDIFRILSKLHCCQLDEPLSSVVTTNSYYNISLVFQTYNVITTTSCMDKCVPWFGLLNYPLGYVWFYNVSTSGPFY